MNSSPETKTCVAWSIKTNNGLISKYWWFTGEPPYIPTQVEGCPVALFRTRKDAREFLPQVRAVRPKAKVVKVNITLEYSS